MRSPGDRGATKPGKLRPSSFKASPQPSTPSRPTPSPVPAPAHTIQDPRKPQNCLGGGGGGPLRTKASPTLQRRSAQYRSCLSLRHFRLSGPVQRRVAVRAAGGGSACARAYISVWHQARMHCGISTPQPAQESMTSFGFARGNCCNRQ